MNFEKKTLLGGGLLLVAAILIALKLSSNDDASPDSPIQPVVTAANRSRPASAPPLVPAPEIRPANSPTPKADSPGEVLEKSSRDAAIGKMQEASTSYDPAELPVIRPYLNSQDPELRAAAVDAMIVLGDASAGPMLREAAKTMDSPEEAKKMQQAADYVELPPVDFKKLKEKMKKLREAKNAAAAQPEKASSNESGAETPAQ